MNSSEIRVVVQFSAPPGNAPEVKEILTRLIKKARDEKGMLRYEWFFNDEETDVYGHEWYADSAAVGAHMEAGGEDLERLHQSATVTRVDAFGAVPDDLREQIKSLNPTIAGYWDGFSR